MQFRHPTPTNLEAILAFPELTPAADAPTALRPSRREVTAQRKFEAAVHPQIGHVRVSVLSFQNMHHFGDLFVSFLRARKRTFIDRLRWTLPETEGMEFDQYDTPLSRWIVIHEFGEVLGGIRLTPTTARCGIYSYMLRDAQLGLLHDIPSDVLFFEAPVSKTVWEASRLFISDDVPSHRRLHIQTTLMEHLSRAARDNGATQVIGIVPAVWSRWLRRMNLDAVPVGPRFSIEGTHSQAALFNTTGPTG